MNRSSGKLGDVAIVLAVLAVILALVGSLAGWYSEDTRGVTNGQCVVRHYVAIFKTSEMPCPMPRLVKEAVQYLSVLEEAAVLAYFNDCRAGKKMRGVGGYRFSVHPNICPEITSMQVKFANCTADELLSYELTRHQLACRVRGWRANKATSGSLGGNMVSFDGKRA